GGRCSPSRRSPSGLSACSYPAERPVETTSSDQQLPVSWRQASWNCSMRTPTLRARSTPEARSRAVATPDLSDFLELRIRQPWLKLFSSPLRVAIYLWAAFAPPAVNYLEQMQALCRILALRPGAHLIEK